MGWWLRSKLAQVAASDGKRWRAVEGWWGVVGRGGAWWGVVGRGGAWWSGANSSA